MQRSRSIASATLLASTLLALSGCGNDDGSDPAAPAFDDAALTAALFLKDADFAAANTSVVSDNEIASEVDDVQDIYENEPKENNKDVDAAFGACVEKNLAGTVTVEGNTVTVVVESKPFECVSKSQGTVKFATYRLSVKGQCEEMTEAGKAQAGKSIAAALQEEAPVCVVGKESRYVTQFKIATSFDVENGGTSYSVASESVSGTSLPGGAPCVTKNGVTDGCVTTEIDTTNVTLNGTPTKSVRKTVFNAKALKVSTDTQAFAESGTAELTLADWKGVVTFSGAAKAPTWSMAKGAATPKTGTFGASAAATPTALNLQRKANDLSKRLAAQARKVMPFR